MKIIEIYETSWLKYTKTKYKLNKKCFSYILLLKTAANNNYEHG